MRQLRLSPEEEALLHEIMESNETSIPTLLRRLNLDPMLSFTEQERQWLDERTAQQTTEFLRIAVDSVQQRTEAVRARVDAARNQLGMPGVSKRFIGARQTTVAREIELSGLGLHTGAPATIVLHPASANKGLIFIISRNGKSSKEIPVSPSSYRTHQGTFIIGTDDGFSVASPEHLLSALYGLSVDNCYIEIDAKEVPALDGSARPFVDAVDDGGLRELSEPRKFIRILKPIRVSEGNSWCELRPSAKLHIDVEIDYEHKLVGQQRFGCDVNPGEYRNCLASARQFGFMRDVEHFWRTGLALGASLENTVALGDDRIMNPEGLRFPDECVRHKALDALAVLALLGPQVIGGFQSVRASHQLNVGLLGALLGDAEAWTYVTAPRVSQTALEELSAVNLIFRPALNRG